MAEPTSRATLDMTAIRDLVDERRPRHADALKLLVAAQEGNLELGVPPQGWLADLGDERSGELAQQIPALLTRPGVVELPQIARLSDVTFPSDTLLPGAYVEGFSEAWDAVVSDWKTHQGRCPGDLDRWYVESHLKSGAAVFLTEDRALRAMCDRLRTEHGLLIHAESLTAFAAGL